MPVLAQHLTGQEVDLSLPPLDEGLGEHVLQAKPSKLEASQISALEARCLTPRDNSAPRAKTLSSAPLTEHHKKLNNLAADVAGIPEDELPDPALIKAAAHELFELMDADHSGYLSKDELIDSCLMYDDRVPIEGIEDTFYAVEDEIEPDPRGLCFDHFYLWLVLMFGDCTNDEFESGTQEFRIAIDAACKARAELEAEMVG
eukprot:TRINITY_DN22635_c0_g1_i1.p1 TRINITY_DN22635_c0_g1~~TRINITY_DN22635_c0_g1_i1.p1  ORF type:complete len:202 (-),score=34.29 TRINITY_DN22635_c0_g1_i1:91-696(-)